MTGVTGAQQRTDAPAVWAEVAARLRAELPEPAFLSFFAAALPLEIDRSGVLTVALANEFCVAQARPHRPLIDEWGAAAGLSGVHLVTRDSVGLPSAELDETDGRLTEAESARDQHERQEQYHRAVGRQQEQPPGLVTRLLAERGFWSLDPAAQLKLFEVDDLQGALQVIPSAFGLPGTYEAAVFTGLLTLWGAGPREEPQVQTSLRNLAELLHLSWSGRTANQLVHAIDVLTLTGYRVTVQNDNGAWSNLFHLLDQVETRWDGPRNSPHSRIRAKFSDPVSEAISQPRVLRPFDLAVFHALGEQRHLARRLFLFLEGTSMGRTERGDDVLERIIDERLAATLGAKPQLYELRRNLARAAQAITSAAPRYNCIEIAPRAKRGLRRGDPTHLLRVVRSRVASS